MRKELQLQLSPSGSTGESTKGGLTPTPPAGEEEGPAATSVEPASVPPTTGGSGGQIDLDASLCLPEDANTHHTFHVDVGFNDEDGKTIRANILDETAHLSKGVLDGISMASRKDWDGSRAMMNLINSGRRRVGNILTLVTFLRDAYCSSLEIRRCHDDIYLLVRELAACYPRMSKIWPVPTDVAIVEFRAYLRRYESHMTSVVSLAKQAAYAVGSLREDEWVEAESHGHDHGQNPLHPPNLPKHSPPPQA